MSISQKDAVVAAVKTTLGSNYLSETAVSDQLTAEQILNIKDTIVKQIQDGEVTFNKDVNDTVFLKKYVSSMVSNHFRKAKELNGGQVYAASPAKAKTVKGDSQLLALNNLLKRFDEGTDEYTKVFTAIKERKQHLSELKEQERKKKKVDALPEVDMNALPEEFHSLVV